MKLSAALAAALSTTAAAAITALALTSAPAMASTLTPAHQATHATASQRLTAWDNRSGYTDLVAVDNALTHRNGPALTHDTALAITHPQPVDTAGYIAMMRVYHAAGIALTHGHTAAANADIAKADDMAWDVITDTFAALNRVSVNS
jgi:hypothetical protein